MNGQVIPLITRRNFPFAGPSAESTVMIKQVDVTQWAQLDLVVRVHDASGLAALPTGPVVKVRAFPYSQDPGDPGEDFIADALTTEAVIDTNGGGQLEVVRLDTPYGNMLRFTVEGVPATAGSAFEAELSFYLVGRSSE